MGGYPVVSSDRVSPYALLEAAYIVEKMLAKRPDVLQALVETKSRLSVMAYDEFTTDIPEHARLGSEKGGQSANWWDRRARGLGGSTTDPPRKKISKGDDRLASFPPNLAFPKFHRKSLSVN